MKRRYTLLVVQRRAGAAAAANGHYLIPPMATRTVIFAVVALLVGCSSNTSGVRRGTPITRVQLDYGLPEVISDRSGDQARFYVPTDRPEYEWPADAPRTFYYLQRGLAITFVRGKTVSTEPIDADLRERVLLPVTRWHGECGSEFPQGAGPKPMGRYRRADLWRPPTEYDLNRMALPDSQDEYTLYRTQWLKGRQPSQLVCVQYPGQELFGTPYRVFVYDQNLRLLRCGQLTAQQDNVPLAIVEVKVEGKEIPPARRGQWQLAVVLADPTAKRAPAKPVRLVGFSEPDDEANYVMCELIAWDGEDDLTGRAGSLSEVDSIEFRTAERHWRVDADGTVHVPREGTNQDDGGSRR